MNQRKLSKQDEEFLHMQERAKEAAKSIKIKGNKITFSIDGKTITAILNYPSLRDKEDYPVIINLHGGGFVAGVAENMDSFCQMLADNLNVLVVNLDYKLYPEVQYPYFPEELESTIRYIRQSADELKVDPKMIGACGFSAGGTIAFGAEVKLLKQNDTLNFLVGIYPMVSGRPEDVEQDSAYPAVDDAMGAAMLRAMNGYEKRDICSSLLAEDEILRQFPYTLIITCGKDSLGNMGRTFAGRLAVNKATVLCKTYENAFHGYVEVNREDFIDPDSRKTVEQEKLTKETEQFICKELSLFLNNNEIMEVRS